MLQRILVLAVVGWLLCGCAAPDRSSGSSQYRCDRNGDYEQRVAC